MSIVPLIYMIAGIIAAAHYNYFERVNTGKQIVSAILAVILWPLLLVGINLHVK